MPRRPRLQFPGAIYHVMSRGNRKLRIYEDDDDRRIFMTTLAHAVHRYRIRLYAWCLMPNHYHLVLDAPRGNLSDAMRHVNGVYTQATNRLRERTGRVFEGRFRSLVIQQEAYLRRVVRYVVLNPVRARLVADVAAWPWSSHRATAGLDPVPSHLSLEWLALAFPEVPPAAARDVYVMFVTGSAARKATLTVSRGVIGSASFEGKVRDAIREDLPDGILPRSYRSVGRPTLEMLFEATLTRRERDSRIVRAHVEYGYRLADIALVLRVHPSTVSLIVRRAMGPAGASSHN